MDDDDFLKINRNITRCFVDLLFENDQEINARSPEERERGKLYLDRRRAERQRTPDQISKQVAEKIRAVGDQLDTRLKDKIKEAMQDLITEQSVWEVGYGQFSTTCSGILSSCKVYVRNGWEQVSVVYIMAGQLISELKYQDDESGPRERQMEGYTGSYLSDSGLQEWTDDKGGIMKVADTDPSTETSSVNFTGTEV